MINYERFLKTVKMHFNKIAPIAWMIRKIREYYYNYRIIWGSEMRRDSYIMRKKSNKSFRNIFFDKKKYINDMIFRSSQKSPDFVPLMEESITLQETDIKLIAFYLPQFHPIPENDAWWGKGFTEWTNVTKAIPQFVGHYQPHLPGELGFYDLRLVDIQRRQIELAKKYGIYGFCYYYYWFSGKRLLERPLNQILENTDIDFPFCICWANENWTRRWDGLEDDILIAQNYFPEDDLAFIKDAEPILTDRRYIKINGKPLLMVYRPGQLPDMKNTVEKWRSYCNDVNIGDIYLVMVQGRDILEPKEYGFDAVAEFPPNEMRYPANITSQIQTTNPDYKGNIFDLKTYVNSKVYLNKPNYKLFKSVFTSWDNTARKPNDATVFWGANPSLYKQWLTNVVEYTKQNNAPQEKIVFINAWNEWAEGAHLEPDRKFGYGYLQATAEVILENRKGYALDKTSDNNYIYLESLISQLQKCYSHPERYQTPEQNKEHRDFLEEQFATISLSSIISNKNLDFKYKTVALRMKVGLYQLEKFIRKKISGNYHEKNEEKLYGIGEFPELLHQKLLKFYSKVPEEALDDEKRQAFEYLRELKYPINITDIIFPYDFVNKYKIIKPPVFYDEKKGLSYVEHYGKKLFFPAKMNINEISEYYNGLCLEQDIESPHCYTDATFSVSDGDICLDIGCAEGNFSLTNIEKVKKVYLFETDPKWNSALSATFEPWKSKVEIINKFVSDKDDGQNITLDTFIKNNNIDVTFVKIDAEGAEESILKGSRKLLKKNNLKVVACTYHRNGDDKLLHGIFSDNGFECSFTKGYMFFVFYEELLPPYLKRGLVRATKTGR